MLSDHDLDTTLRSQAHAWQSNQPDDPPLDAAISRLPAGPHPRRRILLRPLAVAAAAALTVLVIAGGVAIYRSSNWPSTAGGPVASTSTTDPSSQLIGSRWTLTSIASDGQTIEAGSYPATLELTRDHQFQLKSDCLFSSGTYEVSSDDLALHTAGNAGGCSQDAQTSTSRTVDSALQTLADGSHPYTLDAHTLTVTLTPTTTLKFSRQ